MIRASRKTSILLGVALWSLSLVAALPAHAAVVCAFDVTNPTYLNVTLAPGDGVTFVRGDNGTPLDASDDELIVGDGTGACTQLLDDVERVVLTGSTGNETAIFDLSGGPLENQATFDEGSGGSDIEFDVDLGTGTDTISVLGALTGSDEVRAGVEGVNLNGDDDADVSSAFDSSPNTEGTTVADGVENYTVDLRDGNDLASGAGTSGSTGADFPQALALVGGIGDDILDGGAANDVMNGGAGADDLLDSSGIDTADYSDRSNPVSLSLDGVRNVQPNAFLGNDGEGPGCFPNGAGAWDYSDNGAVETQCENDTIHSGVENLRGGSGNDRLQGDGDANGLFGMAGDDLLIGNAGGDTMIGGADNDTENGGTGSDRFNQESAANGSDDLNGGLNVDTLDYGARSAAVNVNLAIAGGDGQAGENDNASSDIERLEGGDASDELRANAGTDYLFGNGGGDLLRGGDGTDKMIGGAGNDDEWGDGGNDTFFQGASFDGNDSLRGGLGSDIVKYQSFSGIARSNSLGIDIDGAADDGEAGESDNVRTDVEKVFGGAAGDNLAGNAKATWLYGQGGNDTLNGRDGNDRLFGGTGNDTANGGVGSDTIRGGSGDDNLNGGDGNDYIYGEAGNDDLTGGAGRDRLNGGDDADTCNTGLGDDPTPVSCNP